MLQASEARPTQQWSWMRSIGPDRKPPACPRDAFHWCRPHSASTVPQCTSSGCVSPELVLTTPTLLRLCCVGHSQVGRAQSNPALIIDRRESQSPSPSSNFTGAAPPLVSHCIIHSSNLSCLFPPHGIVLISQSLESLHQRRRPSPSGVMTSPPFHLSHFPTARWCSAYPHLICSPRPAQWNGSTNDRRFGPSGPVPCLFLAISLTRVCRRLPRPAPRPLAQGLPPFGAAGLAMGRHAFWPSRSLGDGWMCGMCRM
jgi:hypothetical protein